MKRLFIILILLFAVPVFAGPSISGGGTGGGGTTLSCTTDFPVLGSGQCGTGTLGTAAYTASTAYDAAGTAAGKIASTISDNDLTHSPDGNSVFDALALKSPLSSPSFTNQVTFDEVVSNGNSGASKTIDWTAGNKQSITTTGNCTLTFTAPAAPASIQLIITHEASATTYTYSWPATVKWPGGVAITNTNTSGAVDIVSFLYDGTNYYATGLVNFF